MWIFSKDQTTRDNGRRFLDSNTGLAIKIEKTILKVTYCKERSAEFHIEAHYYLGIKAEDW